MLYSLTGAIALALFGAIYELFSHEVYSYFMIYAFAFPLLLGALPSALLLLKKREPGRTGLWLWNAGTATLSVGSLFRGVLDIYGTTNSKSVVYSVVGALLLLAGLIAAIAHAKKQKKNF